MTSIEWWAYPFIPLCLGVIFMTFHWMPFLLWLIWPCDFSSWAHGWADDTAWFLVLYRRLLGWFSFSVQKLLAFMDFCGRSTFIQVVSLRVRYCLSLFAFQNCFSSVFEYLSMMGLTVHFFVLVLLGVCSFYLLFINLVGNYDSFFH